MLSELIEKIQDFANPEKAKNLQKFFKTGEGEYGEGDIFLGLTVPQIREIIKDYTGLNLIKIEKLLESKIHEHRLAGALILVNKYKKSSEREKEEIFNFYLKNSENINNWDLVDLSCHKIVGDFLLNKNRKILYELVHSDHLWKKRIAIVSTSAFIRNEDFEDILAISEILLEDKHDLIQKAIGWMLREVGKRDLEKEEYFLKRHYKKMPRTMLRYAIEKFEEEKRKKYLKGEI